MQGIVACVLSSLTWAIGSTTYVRDSRKYSAFSINMTRGLVAFPFFFVTSLFLGDWSAVPNRFWDGTLIWYCVSIFASYGIGDLVFLAAARRIGVPGALAIGSIFPLWNTLLGVWLRRELLSVQQVLGLIVTLSFVVVVILGRAHRERGAPLKERRSRREAVHGISLALATSVFWATNSFSIAQAGGRLDPWVTNSIRLFFAFVMAWALGSAILRRWIVPLPWRELRPVFPIYFIEAYGGSTLYVYGLSHTTMAVGAVFSSLAPILAVPIAWTLGTERVSFFQLFSISGVMTGLWLLTAG